VKKSDGPWLTVYLTYDAPSCFIIPPMFCHPLCCCRCSSWRSSQLRSSPLIDYSSGSHYFSLSGHEFIFRNLVGAAWDEMVLVSDIRYPYTYI